MSFGGIFDVSDSIALAGVLYGTICTVVNVESRNGSF